MSLFSSHHKLHHHQENPEKVLQDLGTYTKTATNNYDHIITKYDSLGASVI